MSCGEKKNKNFYTMQYRNEISTKEVVKIYNTQNYTKLTQTKGEYFKKKKHKLN